MFAVTAAFGASAFMTFVTNASFAYIDYFGVSAALFPLYFSIGVLGLVATNVFSMKRLKPSNAPRFFRFGLALQLMAVTALLLGVLAGAPSIWFVVVPVAVIVSCFGLVGPSGSSQYMGHFQKLAGSASSLYTTLLFSSGAIFGAVSGLFFDGTLLPMALTMFVASLAANATAFSTGATFRRVRAERTST